MSCLCGAKSKVKDISPILDITKIMQDWAWKSAMEDIGYRRLFMRRRDYNIEVPMNFYQFTDSETHLTDIASENKSSAMVDAWDAKNSVSQAMSKTTVLSTEYENDTDSDQTYTFRMERARNASVTVTYQKGFSFGGKTHFTIGVAEAELKGKLEITKATGQTFEETLTFETNSDIIVKANSNCTAHVVFSEREVCKEFEVKTRMSMPSGRAPIFIRRKEDNQLIHSFIIGDLRLVFHDQKSKGRVEFFMEAIVDGYSRYAIMFTTTGILEGVSLSGQTVKLHSEKRKGKGKVQTRKVAMEEHYARELSNHL